MRKSLLVASLICVSCQAVQEAQQALSGDTCDTKALERLADELAAMPARERSRKVWAGVNSACEGKLSTSATYAYDPSTAAADQQGVAIAHGPDDLFRKRTYAVCPDYDEVARARANAPADERSVIVYEGCDLARFDLLSTREQAMSKSGAIVTWGMHHWMLEQGLAPAQAKTISRALFALEVRNDQLWLFPEDVELPVAKGPPLPDGALLTISPAEILFNDKKVEALTNGRLDDDSKRGQLVTSLYEALAEEADKEQQIVEQRGDRWNESIIVAADAQTPYDTMVAVLNTAGRAGYVKQAIVVETEDGLGLGHLPVSDPGPYSVPKPSKDTPPDDDGDDDPNADADGDADGDTKLGPATSRQKSDLYAMKGPKDAVPQMARNFDPELAARGLPGTVGVTKGSHATIEVTPTGYALVRPGASDAERSKQAHQGDDFEPIAEFAKAMKDDDAKRLVVTATGDTNLRRLVSVMAAAHESGTIISLWANAGYEAAPKLATPYGNTFAVGNDDDDVWGGLGGTPSDASDGTTKRIPRVRTGAAKVEGNLDKDIVRRIIRAHINEVRSCYQAGLTRDPDLAGRVAISFIINGMGQVTSSVVESSSLGDDDVDTCIAKAVKKWRFPKPADGTNVNVIYPFNLDAG